MSHKLLTNQQTNPIQKAEKNTTLYLTCNYETNPILIEKARTFVQSEYSKLGYVGYDAEFDRQFDRNGLSQYFIGIDNAQNIVATARVLTRGPLGLPIEYAIRKDSEQKVELGKGKISEMNSFAASNMTAGIRVLVMSAEFVLQQNYDATFGLYDTERPSVGRLYNRFGTVDSKDHPYLIYYPNYGKIEAGIMRPTEWAIQVSDYTKIIAKIRQT
ncbi:LBL_2463 family protein [Leptospira kmetyi]|uniref:Uncharacterized protein n=1 Tax=Leptospira kmetyi TaxID=408139 RepID=A0ABX4N741_9LEPT|nr:hypothetical protein [Leptospira kmetyi]PJZ29124.1 hypothetical protein CH378_14665 [Leptospira kmetyi]PJZ39709.1 hypothetical protein CH370_19850 [Leptospira kmetyi]